MGCRTSNAALPNHARAATGRGVTPALTQRISWRVVTLNWVVVKALELSSYQKKPFYGSFPKGGGPNMEPKIV